jgi:L-threonylcarbamoyladenylate synthase
LELLKLLDFPLAAPSANPFGYVSPTSPEHVLKHFDGVIPMVLDGGACTVGIESTIVGTEGDDIVVYRLGGLAIEDIESIVGKVTLRTSSSKPDAPGMLLRHYAPNKPVIAIRDQAALEEAYQLHARSGCLLYALRAPEGSEQNAVFQLSENNDPTEAAARFYKALRTMGDREDIGTILVEVLPDFQLGRAINDRLRRAAVEKD